MDNVVGVLSGPVGTEYLIGAVLALIFIVAFRASI
jgi:hypothetical protein